MRTIGEPVQKASGKDGTADVTAVARQRAVALENCLLASRIPQTPTAPPEPVFGAGAGGAAMRVTRSSPGQSYQHTLASASE